MSFEQQFHKTIETIPNLNMEDRKPYLDKICVNAHTPSPEGAIEFNSVNTFPSLRHTGIRSKFEPPTTVVTNPHGRITSGYKDETFRTAQSIYRDDIELKSREVAFKTSHKQFIDLVLLDMEAKKRASLDRRAKHWTQGKSQLGFSEQFNSSSAVKHIEEANRDTWDIDLEHTQNSVIPKNTYNPDTTTHKTKPFSRMSLFKTLLETEGAPQTHKKHYGTIHLPPFQTTSSQTHNSSH